MCGMERLGRSEDITRAAWTAPRGMQWQRGRLARNNPACTTHTTQHSTASPRTARLVALSCSRISSAASRSRRRSSSCSGTSRPTPPRIPAAASRIALIKSFRRAAGCAAATGSGTLLSLPNSCMLKRVVPSTRLALGGNSPRQRRLASRSPCVSKKTCMACCCTTAEMGVCVRECGRECCWCAAGRLCCRGAGSSSTLFLGKAVKGTRTLYAVRAVLCGAVPHWCPLQGVLPAAAGSAPALHGAPLQTHRSCAAPRRRSSQGVAE